ncbi:TetR/AcrR family transcriptional regulator [Actinoplanes sp. NPDC049668]|uniref:TetR/AcrR family transcriptional regulator n=1 Tax=unclassified Actinoplanes TaxID=2626549 RepID=UPI0033A86171
MAEGYLKGRIRREDIVTAAVEVYAEAGYHASSLREVARRVGITHAGLLYYFPTKEALLAAVLERRDAEDAEREPLAEPAGLDALRRLIALAGQNAEVYSRLAAEAVTEGHPAHAYFERQYAAARRDAVDSFRVLAERGELREGVDPGYAGLNLVALVDGLRVQWLSNGSAVDLAGALSFHLQDLLTVPLD